MLPLGAVSQIWNKLVMFEFDENHSNCLFSEIKSCDSFLISFKQLFFTKSWKKLNFFDKNQRFWSKSYCCHVSFFYSFSGKIVLTGKSSRKRLKNPLKMSSKSIKMNDFSTGNQLERFFRFAVSNLHAFCSIRFCQIRSKKNDDFDELTLFFVLFL